MRRMKRKLHEVNNHSEKCIHLSETEFCSTWYQEFDEDSPTDFYLSPHTPTNPQQNIEEIQQMIDPTMDQIHGIFYQDVRAQELIDKNDIRNLGLTWVIDPQWGKGTYWYAIVDSDIVLSSMHMHFFKQVEMKGISSHVVGFGLYAEDMSVLLSGQAQHQHERVIGYICKKRYFKETLLPHRLFKSCAIMLLPSALFRISRLLQVEPEQLTNAISSLNDYEHAPELASALTDLAATRPSSAMAPIYYRAKIMECLSLVIDETSHWRNAANACAAEDTRLCKMVTTYIVNHLAKDVSTRSLSDAFHVSEARLIAVFRAVLKKTPQMYVREKRMNHAKELLARCNGSIGEIAQSCGYTNQGAFSEAFKLYTKVTPSQYRKGSR